MRLVQFWLPGKGKRVGLVEGEDVYDITAPREGIAGTCDLVAQGGSETGMARIAKKLRAKSKKPVAMLEALDRVPSKRAAHLLIPLDPPEVWGAGITYKRSAEFRDKDTGHEKGMYDYVYDSPRPELFFKATAARCVGPNAPVGVRSDSQLTAPEPEVAFVLGTGGKIVGFTACNDVSAWDIERENPLFLPLSKIYAACCALGPVLVTSSEIRDPYGLTVKCRLIRGGETIFTGETSTRELKRRFEELAEWLLKDNVIPPGTVVATGTGIMVPNELCLQDGDRIEIEVAGIGTLINPVHKLAARS